MSEMQEQENAVHSAHVDPVPLVAIDFEQIDRLIRDKYGKSMAEDDPTLFIVTILNVYLQKNQELLDAHNKALTRMMGAATQQTIKGIQDEARIFSEDFKDAAIAATMAKVGEHQAAMGRFLGTLESQLQNAKMQMALMTAGCGLMFVLSIAILLLSWLKNT